MPTTLEQALANIETKILAISANPKPNYSIDGQSVSYGDWMKQLLQQKRMLEEEIARAENYEVIEQGYT